MTFAEYDKQVVATAIYPGKGTITGLAYVSLGTCGESGEIAEKVKKIIRDRGGVLSETDKKNITLEVGDVLWYLSSIMAEIGLTLEHAAASNIAKLKDRQARAALQGDGDYR